MKKIFIAVAMTLMMGQAAMAQNAENVADVNTPVINYTLRTTNHSIDRYLDLSIEQSDEMASLLKQFNRDLRRVSRSKEEKRADRLYKAVASNLAGARQTLDDRQFHKYLVVFNYTIKNKGLDQLFNEGALAAAE